MELLQLKENQVYELIESVKSTENISGLTHNFYNYPARFSPYFVRKVIELFSNEGDLVIDPFMGGGTTLLEAKLLNRDAIGTDISSLAAFITKVKLTPLNEKDINIIDKWFSKTKNKLNCHRTINRPLLWIEKGYQRNLSDSHTWAIRKLNEQFIYEVEKFSTTKKIKDFLRCSLLKTSQWALDSKISIPSAKIFRERLEFNITKMSNDSLILKNQIFNKKINSKIYSYNKSANEISRLPIIKKLKKAPKIIVTSPPYPGIHVVYHRWQIHGKKETPAPFWIANSLDGYGLTYYILGDRKQKELKNYFNNIGTIFSSLRSICDKDTIIVQLIAFSNPNWQLNRYLEEMNKSGFKEIEIDSTRIWRNVPNRKWYAQNKGETPSSKEVVLIHKRV